MSGPRVLVAGCGFLGAEVARLLAEAGREVTGCTHSAESAAALAGAPFRVVTGDFTQAADVAGWGSFEVVIHAASSRRGGPEAYRQVYLEGLRCLWQTLAPKQVIFVSSTSVYAQTDGAWVTEESPTEPDRETGRILRETEELALAHGGAVARLAGIYGPGRSVLLKKFLSGEARVEGDGQRWLNQIHRDDAATALAALVAGEARGVWNVADDEPLRQRELYAGLAARLQRPMPPDGPIDLARKRGWTHKRVSNVKLRALGWAPRWSSFFAALEGDARLLAAAGSPLQGAAGGAGSGALRS